MSRRPPTAPAGDSDADRVIYGEIQVIVVLRKIVKKVVPSASWQHPVINAGLRALDPLDWLVRRARGRHHMPRYSIRARSNGAANQFGGRNFERYGRFLADLLVQRASLTKKSRVLEIGCGCGRTAFALTRLLAPGNYVGMDIERKSLESCKSDSLLKGSRFSFDYLDVQNDLYNRNGAFKASEYRFPYADSSFDIVFLVSVFTHMLTADVRNYIGEICRMLTPGGVCMMSTFLLDYEEVGKGCGLVFPYSQDECRYRDRASPEAAVGYPLSFFRKEFERHNALLLGEPRVGSWRGNRSRASQPVGLASADFSQDILFFQRRG